MFDRLVDEISDRRKWFPDVLGEVDIFSPGLNVRSSSAGLSGLYWPHQLLPA